MTLGELKIRVDYCLKNGHNSDMEVVIPNNKMTMGGVSTTKIIDANRGFDWNHNDFIIWPEIESYLKPTK
jgi:hypothetical protein